MNEPINGIRGIIKSAWNSKIPISENWGLNPTTSIIGGAIGGIFGYNAANQDGNHPGRGFLGGAVGWNIAGFAGLRKL